MDAVRNPLNSALDSRNQADKHRKGAAPGEFALGTRMRGMRATLGKSLLDVHKETGLRPFVVHAIENGDLEAFSNKSLILGSVRQYARYLELNEAETLQRFCAETGHSAINKSTARGVDVVPPMVDHMKNLSNGVVGSGLYSPIATNQDRSLSTWSDRIPIVGFSVFALAAGLVAGGGYLMWTLYDQVTQTRDAATATFGIDNELRPEVPSANLALIDGETVALDNSEELPRIGELQPSEIQEDTLEPEFPELLIASPFVSAPVPETQPEQSPSEESPNAAGLEEEAAAAPAEEPAVAGFYLVPTEPAWVRITEESSGEVHLERILDTGEQFEIPQVDTPLLMRAGMSGFLYFLVDGEVFGPVGRGAQIVRDVQLDRDAIRASYPLVSDELVPEEFQELSGPTQIESSE